jgi:hypothetical protein
MEETKCPCYDLYQSDCSIEQCMEACANCRQDRDNCPFYTEDDSDVRKEITEILPSSLFAL